MLYIKFERHYLNITGIKIMSQTSYIKRRIGFLQRSVQVFYKSVIQLQVAYKQWHVLWRVYKCYSRVMPGLTFRRSARSANNTI